MKTIRLALVAVLVLAVQHSCLASTEKEDGGEDNRTAVQRLYTPRPLEDYPLCLQKLGLPPEKLHQMFLDSPMGPRYKKQFAPYYASTEGIKDDPELVELINTIPMLLRKEDYPEDIQELDATDQKRHIRYLSRYRRPVKYTPLLNYLTVGALDDWIDL